MMYAQPSPRSSRQDLSLADHRGQSPTKPSMMGLRSGGHGAVLSPSRTRRRSSGTSNQGSRSGSPLNLPMDSPYSLGPSLLTDTHSVSSMPSPGRSPFQSPAHSRSSSVTSVKNLFRERGDRNDHHLERHGPLIRDRSLDRQLDRQGREFDRIPMFSARDRSVDRERERDYPHMGARSLDREGQHHHPFRGNLVRSRSIDHEFLANQAAFLPSTHDLRHTRDTLLLDLQGQIAELTKECMTLTQELELTQEKLGSSMNSIKTFWSPELKKERVLRKEETSRLISLTDQLKITQAESKRMNQSMELLETEVRLLRGGSQSSSVTSLSNINSMNDGEAKRQAKEIVILKRTIEEMDIRIETQKSTLSARDESIKKLLEMLQNKGLSTQQMEEDRIESDRLRQLLAEEERQRHRLQIMLDDRDREMDQLKSDLLHYSEEVNKVQEDCDKARRETGSHETLHALMETKDARNEALEREVRVLEDELLRLREESLSLTRNSQDNHMQVETLKSQERLSKIKIENVKGELQRKETDYCALKTHKETLEKQGIDQQRHIGVLKEQIAAKDQQMSMVQADLELARERLEEKEGVIEKKGKQVLLIQQEKKRSDNEIIELRELMELRERKVSVLQRKVDNAEEMLREKEALCDQLKGRLRALHADQDSTDNAISNLEDTIAEKEKQIERMKEQRDTLEQEHQEEIDNMQQGVRDLKARLEERQSQLEEKQNEVLELREEASELKSERRQRDTQISQFELMLGQRADDITDLHNQIKKLEEERVTLLAKKEEEGDKRKEELQQQLQETKDQAGKTQTEVDRLLNILQEMEGEKHAKDDQIRELTEQLKDSRQKVGTLKRSSQVEKNKNANMLEEARKREDEVNEDASLLKNQTKQMKDRIEELEEALRESVKITAQREVHMAQQQMRLEATESQVKAMVHELEKMRNGNDSSDDQDEQVAALSKQLSEKDEELQSLLQERKNHLQEVYEMKQEATLAAISEKDAHIAILEASPSTKKNLQEIDQLNQQKTQLQQQLKELTQKRMKLMPNNGNNGEAHCSGLKNASSEQVIRVIQRTEHNKKRLKTLIDQLVATCLEIDHQLLEAMPRLQQSMTLDSGLLKSLSHCKLLDKLRKQQEEKQSLRDYANILISRLRERRPGSLHAVVDWLNRTMD